MCDGGLGNKFSSDSECAGLAVIYNNCEIFMRNAELDNGKVDITHPKMRKKFGYLSQ